MKYGILFLMLIVVSSFSLVQSETFGYGRTESIPVNYSTIPTVNNSEYFDGYSISSLYTYYRGLLDSIFAPITEPLSLHLNGDNSPTATIDWDGQDLINVDNLNATTLTVGNANITGLLYGNGSQLTGISTDYTNVAWLNESDQIFASNQTFNESITGGTGGLTGTRGSLILRGTGIMATGRTSYIEMTAFGDGTPVFITTTASKFFFSNESPKDITPSTPSATVSIDTTTGAMTMADGKFGIGDDGSIEIPIASGSPSYDGVDFSVQAQGGAGRGGPFDGGDAGDNYFLGGIAGTAFGFGTDGESGNVIAQGGLGGTKNGSVILAPDFQGVLIGTTNVSKLNSTNLLHIDGSASASAWLVTSDRLEKSSIQVVDNSSDRFRYKYYLEHDEPIWEIYQENVSYINEKGDLVWEMIDKQKVVGYQMVSSNEYSYGLISDEVDNTFVKKSDGRDVIDLYSLSSQNYIDIGKNQDEIILLKQENEAKDLIIESLISRIEALENPLGVGSL